MIQPTPKAAIRALKGAPWSIIMSLLVGGTMTGIELQSWTGYKKDTVLDGLQVLLAWGLVQNAGKRVGWYLTNSVTQLPLPFDKLSTGNAGMLGGGDNFGDSSGVGIVDNFDVSIQKAIFPPLNSLKAIFPPLKLTTTALKKDSNTIDLALKQAVSKKQEEKAIFPPLKPQDVDNFSLTELISGDADKLETYQLLISQGVGKQSEKMKELLTLPYSADEIRLFCEDRVRRLLEGEKYSVGLLIYRLIDGDSVPVDENAGICDGCGLRDCLCEVIQK